MLLADAWWEAYARRTALFSLLGGGVAVIMQGRGQVLQIPSCSHLGDIINQRQRSKQPPSASRLAKAKHKNSRKCNYGSTKNEAIFAYISLLSRLALFGNLHLPLFSYFMHLGIVVTNIFFET